MMIYDLLPIQIPDNFLPIAVEHYVHQLRLMRYCETLLTDSAHLPSILHGALAMMESEAPPQIKPQPLHISKQWSRNRYVKVPLSTHFAQIGAIETRKNHHYALAAFTQLKINDSAYSIVGRERKIPDFMKQLIDFSNRNGQKVVFRHGLTDDDIISLFESVTASICPSTAEGYGLPVLESLAMGVPVIASDIPPHRQFAPIGGIIYFDATSVESLMLAMREVSNVERNAELRGSIRSDRIPDNTTMWARNARLALES
jgi:glycosyltransferase involved in cell wall biosynthesis